MIIGVTGIMASGKSMLASILSDILLENRVSNAVFNADKYIHKLYQNAEISSKIADIFPESIIDGVINRRLILSSLDHDKFDQLENILLHEIENIREEFIKKHSNKSVIILDIPLLFELDIKANYTISTNIPDFLQINRCKKRGLSLKEIGFLNSRQFPQIIKNKLADITIKTSTNKRSIRNNIIMHISGINLHI